MQRRAPLLLVVLLAGGCPPLFGRQLDRVVGPLVLEGGWSWAAIVMTAVTMVVAMSLALALTSRGDRARLALGALQGLVLFSAIAIALSFTAVGALLYRAIVAMLGWVLPGEILVVVLAMVFGVAGNWAAVPLGLFFAYHDPRLLHYVLFPSQLAGLLRFVVPLLLGLLVGKRKRHGD